MSATVPPPALPTLSATMSFDAASQAVLAFLQDHLPLSVWTVTRVENGRQTVLSLPGSATMLGPSASWPWEHSFCVRMLAGEAPAVAADVDRVAAYVEQRTLLGLPIHAYAGSAITDEDGSLFGLICGLNDTPVDPERMAEMQPLLALLCQLLGMVLHADRARDRALRAATAARLEAQSCPLTGLLNRRGWEDLLRAEELLQRKYADPTVVVLVDLDRLKVVNDTLGHEAGDEHIRAAAMALQEMEPDAPIARLGGDEFGLLLRNVTVEEGEERARRLTDGLEQAGTHGSVGWAPHRVVAGFPDAMRRADEAMYAAKRARRAAAVA